MVEENASSFPLYFHPVELTRKVYGKTEVYSRKDINVKQAISALNMAGVPSLTVVVTPLSFHYVAPTLVVISEKESIPSLKADYMRAYFRSLFPLGEETGEWIWDLLASLKLKQEAHTAKAKEALTELNRQLTAEEKQKFVSEVLKRKDDVLTLKVLDQALSNSHDGTTTYFSDISKRKGNNLLLFAEEKVCM